MAREEHARENLMQEATALVRRVELRVAGFEGAVVAGFRRDGAASCFFGEDPVYQFNARGELRRAYRAGLLMKAEHGGLCTLERKRTPEASLLVRRDLTAAEAGEFLDQARRNLGRLAAALSAGEFTLMSQVPENGGVVELLRCWLAELPNNIAVAAAPGLK